MRKLTLILLTFLLLIGNCFAQTSALTKDTDTQIYRTTIGVEGDEVIIGDVKTPDIFVPEVTFTRWNKENSLSIKFPDGLITSTSPALSADKIEYKDSKTGFYTNPDPNNADNLKFGLVLYEKPLTNIFTLQLIGWEEFDFFFQPPLANENPDGSTWEDNGLGGTSTRPADVNGSYAVYHKTKKDHIIGQINYTTGKFCHIYRPKFIDANGDWTWADLHIDKGDYTITIPQKFLDTAAYPIKANDTFGYTTIGGSIDANANILILCKASSTPASNGTLDSLTMYGSINSGSPAFNPALYSDVAGTPTSRLAYMDTGGTAFAAGAAWVTTNLSYGSLVASTQYHLGMKSGTDGVNYNVWYDTGTNETAYDTNHNTWQVTYTVQGTVNQRRSIYATYTASGGGGGNTSSWFMGF